VEASPKPSQACFATLGIPESPPRGPHGQGRSQNEWQTPPTRPQGFWGEGQVAVNPLSLGWRMLGVTSEGGIWDLGIT